jgi:lipid II:glycine glycyltransferase (peptidoglycan interpeptide bridge formation enzyme)
LHEIRRNTNSRCTQVFFKALAQLALTDDRIKWVWCQHENKPVASSIFFREGISILHWQMYYDESMSHLQATKLIPYLAAKQAARQGIEFLNLGASPPGAGGAEFYKSKWGGEIFNYNTYVYKSFLGRFW